MRLAIEATKGRVRDAAKLLDTSRSTLYAYLGTRLPPTLGVGRVAEEGLG